MKGRVLGAVCAVVAACLPCAASAAAPGLRACTEAPRPGDVAWAIERTVRVETPDGVGSGVVVSPDGLALTAAHVVEGERWVTVIRNGRRQSGRVVRFSRQTDLALIKLDEDEAPCMPALDGLPAVGSDVVAIGAPGGRALPESVSKGIVSGIRQLGGVDIVQTDAPVNPGNSGGPLVGGGSLVGIVSYKIVGEELEGLGFAVAASFAPVALGFSWSDRTDPQLTNPSGAPTELTMRTVTDAPEPDEPVQFGPWQRRPYAAVRAVTGGFPELYGASASLYLPRPLAFEIGITRRSNELGSAYARLGGALSLREPRDLQTNASERYHEAPKYPAFDVLVEPMVGARFTEDLSGNRPKQRYGADGIVAVDFMVWFNNRTALDVQTSVGGTWWVLQPPGSEGLSTSPDLRLACGMAF